MHHSFASDNCSGIHPVILQAISDANHSHQSSYGKDDHTEQLNHIIKQQFGDDATGYLVFNGTGANIIALQALSPRYGGVICTRQAHIANDESNAPQHIAGLRLLPVDSLDGKLTPDAISSICRTHQGNPHAPQPTTVYISQVTELGTCYTLDEIRQIVITAKSFGLTTYVDGARLANACVHLDCSLKDIADTGVDILTLGGTKNGLMVGECIVVLNPKFDAQMQYLRKNNLHLASKMRFISAQFLAWFADDLWLDLARHSNQMAIRLHDGIKQLHGVSVTQAVESNAVFAILPQHIAQKLHEQFYFYDWNVSTGEVRWVMSFDTTSEQVDALVSAIKALSV